MERGEKMENILKNINTFITADYIALLSVIITILIFVISRHMEIRYKRHDDKKIQYLKLIDLMQKSLSDHKKNKKGEPVLTDEMKKLFFDTGASLLLYGSKRIYRQFIFIKRIYTDFIRPIFAGISIVVKYIIIIPLGHLLIKVFPRFFDKAQKNDELPK